MERPALVALLTLLFVSRGDLVEEEAEQLLRAADADGDGEVSRWDLQEWLHLVQAGGVVQGPSAADHASAEAAEARASVILSALDTDGSSRLNLTEVAEFAILLRSRADAVNRSDVRKNLLARARTPAPQNEPVRTLEKTLDGKADDPRCQGKSDGWLCLTSSRMLYCSAGKRLYGERSCGFEGRCKAGVLGTGGCDYPWCYGRVDGGSFCRGSTVYRCSGESANGRVESVSHFQKECHGDPCREWHDGRPPSRRRRTCNGGRSCHWCWHDNDDCREDPQDFPFADCGYHGH